MFFQILALGYMTKTLNQIIFFFLHQNQNIFFSNIGNQNIFLKKAITPPPPPFKLNGRSLKSIKKPVRAQNYRHLHFTLTMILMMYAKGGNVNMTDKLCVEIYWNYQPFPINIHANVLLNFLTYINMRYFCLYFVRKYPSVFLPCTIFVPGKVVQRSIYSWNIVEKWRLNTHNLI